MLAQQKADVGLNRGAQIAGSRAGANDGSSAVVSNDHRPRLSDAGISKDLSSRAQKLAAVPEAEFEAEIGEWSDNKIAKDFGFSHPFVGNVRRSLETVSSDKPVERTYTTSPP